MFHTAEEKWIPYPPKMFFKILVARELVSSDLVSGQPVDQVVDGSAVRWKKLKQSVRLVPIKLPPCWMSNVVSSSTDQVVDAVQLLFQNVAKIRRDRCCGRRKPSLHF